MAPCNGVHRPILQSWSSPPPNHCKLQWHPAMAPRPLPESWPSPSPSPTIAFYNGTLQWHHVCSIPQSRSSPSPPNHSTLQWHLAMATSNVHRPLPQSSWSPHSTPQWHPAMAPRPLPQSWSSPPKHSSKVGRHAPPATIARYNGTWQWHPAMAPRPLPQSWSSPLPQP